MKKTPSPTQKILNNKISHLRKSLLTLQPPHLSVSQEIIYGTDSHYCPCLRMLLSMTNEICTRGRKSGKERRKKEKERRKKERERGKKERKSGKKERKSAEKESEIASGRKESGREIESISSL
jgi:hypothetical protein